MVNPARKLAATRPRPYTCPTFSRTAGAALLLLPLLPLPEEAVAEAPLPKPVKTWPSEPVLAADPPVPVADMVLMVEVLTRVGF